MPTKFRPLTDEELIQLSGEAPSPPSPSGKKFRSLTPADIAGMSPPTQLAEPTLQFDPMSQLPSQLPGLGQSSFDPAAMGSTMAPDIAPQFEPAQQPQLQIPSYSEIKQQLLAANVPEEYVPGEIDAIELQTGQAIHQGQNLRDLEIAYTLEADPAKKAELLDELQYQQRLRPIHEKRIAKRRAAMERLGVEDPREYQIREQEDPFIAVEPREEMQARVDAAKTADEKLAIYKEWMDDHEAAAQRQKDPVSQALWDNPISRGVLSGITGLGGTVAETGLRVIPNNFEIGQDASRMADQFADSRARDDLRNQVIDKQQGAVAGYTREATEMLTKYGAGGLMGSAAGLPAIFGVNTGLVGQIYAESSSSAYGEVANNKEMTDAQKDIYAATMGAANAGFTLVGGAIAGKLGGKTVEQILSGAGKKGLQGAPTTFKKFLADYAKGVGVETLAEEFPTYFTEGLARYQAGLQGDIVPDTWQKDLAHIAIISTIMQGAGAPEAIADSGREKDPYFDRFMEAMDRLKKDDGTLGPGVYKLLNEDGSERARVEVESSAWRTLKQLFGRPVEEAVDINIGFPSVSGEAANAPSLADYQGDMQAADEIMGPIPGAMQSVPTRRRITGDSSDADSQVRSRAKPGPPHSGNQFDDYDQDIALASRVAEHYGVDPARFEEIVTALRPQSEEDWNGLLKALRDESAAARPAAPPLAGPADEAPVDQQQSLNQYLADQQAAQQYEQRQVAPPESPEIELTAGDEILFNDNGQSRQGTVRRFDPETGQVDIRISGKKRLGTKQNQLKTISTADVTSVKSGATNAGQQKFGTTSDDAIGDRREVAPSPEVSSPAVPAGGPRTEPVAAAAKEEVAVGSAPAGQQEPADQPAEAKPRLGAKPQYPPPQDYSNYRSDKGASGNYPPNIARQWIWNSINRRPEGVETTDEIANWFRTKFDDDYYWRYLKDENISLEEAIDKIQAEERARPPRAPSPAPTGPPPISSGLKLDEEEKPKPKPRLQSKPKAAEAGAIEVIESPGAAASRFKIGDRVTHETRGTGTIEDILGDKLSIAYDKDGGSFTVRTDPRTVNLVEDRGDYRTIEKPNRVELGKHFASILANKSIANIAEARAIASTLLGGKVEPGTQAAKDVDEAVEQGVVRAARKIIAEKKSPEETFNALIELYNRQPNLSVRTSTSMQQQAYSTPAPIAYLLQHLAGVTPDVVSFDSSAGNGMLLTASNKPVANELNPDRAESLRQQDIETTQNDATGWRPSQKFRAVTINPPFGAVQENGRNKVWNVDGVQTEQIDHAITLNTLPSMTSDGKSAIIIGSKGFEASKPKPNVNRAQAYSSQKAFYDKLYDDYNVVDHFTISGDLYSKQGAKFPVDIIVVDGKGASSRPRPWNFKQNGLPKVYQTWEELLNDKIRNNVGAVSGPEREGGSEQGQGGLEGVPRPTKTQGSSPGEAGGSSGRPNPGSMGSQGGQRPGSQESGRPGRPGRVPGDTEGDDRPKPEQIPAGNQSGGPDSGSRPTDDRGLAPSGAVDQAALDDAVDNELDEILGSSPKKKLQSLSEKAAEARTKMDESAKALIDALKKQRGDTLTSTGVDPGLVKLAVKAAVDAVNAGAYTFAEYVATFYKMAPEMIHQLAPYLETAWERLRGRDPSGGKMEPTGRVADLYPQESKPKKDQPKEAETEFQVAYAPKSKGSQVGTLLPINQAQAIMRALDNVEVKYGDIDTFVAKELGLNAKQLGDYFSAEQVDALALAISNDKSGQAFILADQTGVGKGRVVAGMMRYAKKKGLVPIFFTEKPSLYADMVRDLTAIGMNSEGKPFNPLITNGLTGKDVIDLHASVNGRTPRVIKQGAEASRRIAIEAIANLENGGGLKARVGKNDVEFDAVFTTYSQTNPVKSDRTWRHDLLDRIAGRGYLILDESHNALGSKQEGQGNDDDDSRSSSGFTRADYLRGLIDAAGNVMYSSATFAKRPEVMDLYSRAGMRDAVSNIANLPGAIARGGVPMQQAVSEMLAEAGLMIRRERSYAGVDFSPQLVDVGEDAPDRTSSIFRGIHQFSQLRNRAIGKMERDLAESGGLVGETDTFVDDVVSGGGQIGNDNATGTSGIDSTNFTSILWNLADQMLVALKANAVADEAIAAYKRGEKPVITIDNTMESALDRYLGESGSQEGDAIDFGFRDYLMHYLRRSREVLIKRDRSDPDSWEQHFLTDDELGPEALAAYREVESQIRKFKESMPASPIDWMRHRMTEAGMKISEITGREWTIDYAGGNIDRGVLTKRSQSEVGNEGKINTVNGFNGGEIDAIIINRSGSTGLSAHASRDFKDTRKRHMIIAQAAKNIDEFMQSLGRIHRTGQVTLPRYTLFMTNAPAENRPAAVLLKKLKSLNANVTGSAGGNVSFDVPDLINKVGDFVVGNWITENIELNEEMANPARFNRDGEVTNINGLAKKVSGRMVLLPIETQKRFWEEIVDQFEQRIAQLEAANQNPLKAPTLDLDARSIERIPLSSKGEDEGSTNPFLQPAYLERVDAKKIGKPYLPQEVTQQIHEFYGVKSDSELGAARKKWEEGLISKIEEKKTKWTEEYNRNQSERFEESIKDLPDDEKSVRRVGLRARLIGAYNQREEQWKNIKSAISDSQLVPGRVVGYTPTSQSAETDGDTDADANEAITGVIVAVHPPKSGNVTAPSRWSVDVALADTQRRVRLSYAPHSLQALSPRDSSRNALVNALKEFQEAGAVGREERYIATGNLLTAAEQIKKANVVFYRDSTGEVKRGMLTPRNFRADQWLQARPAVFGNGKDVLTFLKEGGRAQTVDGVLLITHNAGNLIVIAPKARSRSGKYTVNPDLLAASRPDEFVSVGQRMELAVSNEKRKGQVLEAILRINGIQANADRELARQLDSQGKIKLIAGGVVSAESTGGSTTANFSRPPRRANLKAQPKAVIPGADKPRSGVATKMSDDSDTQIRGIPAPEMVELARELLGRKLPLIKRLKSALGQFRSQEGNSENRRILLNPSIAKNEHTLAAVLAHEIGHLADYLPEATLKRGNILGRLASLRSFLKGYLDGVGNNRAIRSELISLTKWWQGDYEGSKDDNYRKTRESSIELYADALSVFLNDPAELRRRAPNFWQGFVDNISNKPEVLEAYMAMQEFLDGTPEEIAADRARRIRGMFARGDEAIIAAHRAREAARQSTFESTRQSIEQYVLERGAPIRRRLEAAKARGIEFSDSENAYYILDELNSIDSPNHHMMTRIEREFYQPAMQQGFTRDDIGEYLFARRIVNERNEIINPLGFTPSAAKEQLTDLRKRLGDEKFKRLEGAMGFWHDIIFESVERAVEAGVYNHETFNTKIKPNKDNYATFAVVHYLEHDAHIPAGIFQQVGTLEDVANPLDATHLKTITLNRLIELNTAKRAVRNLLQSAFPEEIKQAPIPYGEREPSKPPSHGMEYMIVLEDGKPTAYEVPKIIARSLMKHDIGGLARAGRLMESAVYKVFHPLFVTYNPGFQVQNPPRDLRRTYLNLAAIGGKLRKQSGDKAQRITLGQVLKAYWGAMGPSIRRGMGLEDETIDRLTREHVLDVPFVSIDPSVIEEDGATKHLLKSHSLMAGDKGDPPGQLRKILGAIGGFIEGIGIIQETLPKVAADKLLQQRRLGQKERSFTVRKYAGTPDYKQRGLSTGLTNSVLMYSKVRWNGLQWDLDLATSKDTAASYWWRRMLWTIMPTTVTKMAAYGLMGPAVAQLYAAIPKYFMDNYDVIPLGWIMGDDDDDDDDKKNETVADKIGKAIFATVQQDDTGRMIQSTWAHILDMAAEAVGLDGRAANVESVAKDLFGDITDNVIGQVNPVLDIASKWAQFASGTNPRDSHFGSDIVPPAEWQAQGWPATSKMLAWTADKFGVVSTIIHGITGPTIGNPFEEGQETTVETVTRSVPGLSRILRVSDRGYSESQWAEVEAAEQERARFKLGLPEEARTAIKRLYQLQRRVDPLSDKESEEFALLKKWYANSYLKITKELQKPGADEKKLKAQLKQESANSWISTSKNRRSVVPSTR